MKKQRKPKQKPADLSFIKSRLWDAMDALDAKFSGEAFTEYIDALGDFLEMPEVQEEILKTLNLKEIYE